jgi:hypothetical protein
MLRKGQHPPPPLHYSYTRTYEIKLGREMFYVLTNPFIFSQYGVPLVMDLRKLADHSHLDQKNSIGMQFKYELCNLLTL